MSLTTWMHSFKKTKGMSALLDERSKRQKDHQGEASERASSKKNTAESEPKSSLKSLVESVKRKSAAASDQPGVGKRRKL